MKAYNSRKGLGKGTGMKGYYNLAPMDSHVHSLSAKGVKTYIEKLFPSGDLLLTNDKGKKMRYSGYSKRDAKKLFNLNATNQGVSSAFLSGATKGKSLHMEIVDTPTETLLVGYGWAVYGARNKATGRTTFYEGWNGYSRTTSKQLSQSGLYGADSVSKKARKVSDPPEPEEKPSPKAKEKVNAGNLVNYMMDYEGGNPKVGDVLELFSYLIKSGQAWSLQGMYGRQAKNFIETGLIDEKGNIIWAKVPNPKGFYYGG